MRIDDQRFPHLLRRAGELRKDQNARIIRVLRRNILLGHEVHAIHQRCDKPDVSGAVEFGEPIARNATVNVTQRRPVDLRVFAVDLTR